MRLVLNSCVLACAATGSLAAQGAPDGNKVLTTFQNPVGDLISVPFQNNTNFPIGSYSRVQDVFADSGARRTGFRGEAEQRSGLIPNTIPG